MEERLDEGASGGVALLEGDGAPVDEPEPDAAPDTEAVEVDDGDAPWDSDGDALAEAVGDVELVTLAAAVGVVDPVVLAAAVGVVDLVALAAEVGDVKPVALAAEVGDAKPVALDAGDGEAADPVVLALKLPVSTPEAVLDACVPDLDVEAVLDGDAAADGVAAAVPHSRIVVSKLPVARTGTVPQPNGASTPSQARPYGVSVWPASVFAAAVVGQVLSEAAGQPSHTRTE